ncbi:signal peptidase II [bacterium]|nr:signal peptidase II [bacterium]
MVVLDQSTKWWAARTLSFYEEVRIIPGVLGLQLVHNFGAAYGIFQNQRWFLVATAVLVLALGWLFRHRLISSEWSRWGMMFVAAGAVGNGFDRVIHGYVIDFIYWHIIPVFNVADIMIDVGIGCFVIEMILETRAKSAQ